MFIVSRKTTIFSNRHSVSVIFTNRHILYWSTYFVKNLDLTLSFRASHHCWDQQCIVFNQLFLLTWGFAVSHCHQEVFPHVKFSPRSKHTGKYSQSDILLGKYSQMGIKGKKGKIAVWEDFRFLALLNNYAAVKHAVFRKNFCGVSMITHSAIHRRS